MMRLIDSTKLIDALPVVAEDKKISLIGAVADMVMLISEQPVIEAEPVRHGVWDSKYDEHDGFYHHFCTECKNLAIFAYDEQDDYDEGMDGEWYLLGKNIVGIKENLTDYCPNCGAKMDKEE